MKAPPSAQTPRLTRRELLRSTTALLTMFGASRRALAAAPTAPIPVQAKIIARILPFERNFAARAKGAVAVLVVEKSADPESASAAKQMQKALIDGGNIGALPVQVHAHTFAGASALLAQCKQKGALVAYLCPGLAAELGTISTILKGTGVLSVAAVEGDVPKGAVLGVEVVDGKPRMSINLAQAKAQSLDFPSAVLKLARIY